MYKAEEHVSELGYAQFFHVKKFFVEELRCFVVDS